MAIDEIAGRPLIELSAKAGDGEQYAGLNSGERRGSI
jgi:hypothetical protein